MRLETIEERQICQYLLGKLEQEQQQRLEEQLMTRKDLFEQLLALEDELIDEYLKNTLSPQDREGFEKHFLLAPERHQKLKFAQAFRSYVAAENGGKKKDVPAPLLWQSLLAALRTQSPALRYGLQGALLTVVVAGLWMTSTTWHLHTEVAQIRTQQHAWQEREQQLQQDLEDQRQLGQALEQQLKRAQAQQRPGIENPLPAMAAFALTRGVVRDSGTLKRVTIPSGTRLVELKLELADNQYENYRVVLDSEGSEILILNKVKPEQIGTHQFVVLTLPANLLPYGDYSLKLGGVSTSGEYNPIGTYYFLRR